MDRKQLPSWIYDHLFSIFAGAVTLLYLIMPYVSYYTYFASFNVSLNDVGLDRPAILTRAIVALVFSLALMTLSGAILVAAFQLLDSLVSLVIAALMLIRKWLTLVEQKAIQRLGLGDRSNSWPRKETPSRRLSGLVAWLSVHGNQPAASWLMGAAIVVAVLAFFLWSQIPEDAIAEDGMKRLPNGWISAVGGVWLYAALCIFLKHIWLRSATLQARIHSAAATAAPTAFMAAISASALLLLTLSFQIGALSAVYTYEHGRTPDASNAWSLLNVDVRCVEVQQLGLKESKPSENAVPELPDTALLYLGKADSNMVLLDIESSVTYRIPASNVAISTVETSPSPCAAPQENPGKDS